MFAGNPHDLIKQSSGMNAVQRPISALDLAKRKVNDIRLITTIIVVLLVSGCSSLQHVQMPPEQLQQEISVGTLIEVGDTVRITTANGERHKFTVTAVTADHISGKNKEIAIADIISVETKEFSSGKTTALAGGAYLIYVLLAAVAAAATVGF